MEHKPVIDDSVSEWLINAPRQHTLYSKTETYNYWASLTKPVEDLNKNCVQNKSVRFKENLEVKEEQRLDINKIVLKWKQKLNNRHKQKATQQAMRQMGSTMEETGIVDSGATSLCRGPHNSLIQTGEFLSKAFQKLTGQIVGASNQAKLVYELCDPARDVEIVPAMKDILVSVGEFADAGYTTVFDKEQVAVYDGQVVVSRKR